MTLIRITSRSVFALSCLLLVQVSAFAQEAEEPPAMLNANLATTAELAGALENEALAEALEAQRPFLSLSELGAALMETLTEEQAEAVLRLASVPINLNSASREEILLIPGVGPRMAHEFEEYRPYVAMAQFRREIGKYVDDDEVERLAAYVFVPVNLNEASDEAILAIPGVGNRMLHEFKEYRPYVNIEQFRREIGKYVDDDELARLERFVRL
ncbi:MAG: hypothetical protein OXU68_08425 [Bacteroidota bacterium]|nr:hypothetical protein [Bacteroidota bacterium]MDE2957013.1 hypothetical protein [Bacteroidota bacterium]